MAKLHKRTYIMPPHPHERPTRNLFTCHFLLASTPSYTVAGLALFVYLGGARMRRFIVLACAMALGVSLSSTYAGAAFASARPAASPDWLIVVSPGQSIQARQSSSSWLHYPDPAGRVPPERPDPYQRDHLAGLG